MIPIRDITPSKNVPVVNYTLIGINVFCFLIQMAYGDNLPRFVYFYGLVPARYTVPDIADYFGLGHQVFSFLSFMFLHGGFLHLLGNMWFLFIFGDNVEDDLGPIRYLGFYLLCGLASGLFHMLLNLHSNMPVIGASGAIAGIMGGYMILYPGSKILTLVPIFFLPIFLEIPAFFFLGFWFLFQFLNAAAGYGGAGGIAWWAHVGGFIAGILLLRFFRQVPVTGMTQRARPLTEKKSSDRLQVIRPTGPENDTDLYGTLLVSPREAEAGTRKVVNIPWGYYKRLFQVRVPPGTREGDVLHLAGLGRLAADGHRGDLLLRVQIRPQSPVIPEQ